MSNFGVKKLERELRPLSISFKSNRACFQEEVSGANIGGMKEVRITSSTIGLQYFMTFASVDEFCVISPVASLGLCHPGRRLRVSPLFFSEKLIHRLFVCNVNLLSPKN